MNPEEVSGRMAAAVKRAGDDAGFIKLEKLHGAVADPCALQRPALEVSGNLDLIVPAGNGWYLHLEQSAVVGTLSAEHGGCAVRVCSSQVFELIAAAVEIGIGNRIDSYCTEVLHFPSIGHAIFINVRDG